MDYLPAKDAELGIWAQGFAGLLSADPARYGLVPAQAAHIKKVTDEFVAALNLATSEMTRTRSTICAKDNARSILVSSTRFYAQQIKDNLGVTDGDKLGLGLRLTPVQLSKVNVPQTSPLLNILGSTPLMHHLRFSDSSTPDSRRKPHGAVRIELFAALTDRRVDPQPTLDDARYVRSYTKNPIEVTYKEEDSPKLATYWARWASHTCEVGRWSLPVSMTIAWSCGAAAPGMSGTSGTKNNTGAQPAPNPLPGGEGFDGDSLKIAA